MVNSTFFWCDRKTLLNNRKYERMAFATFCASKASNKNNSSVFIFCLLWYVGKGRRRNTTTTTTTAVQSGTLTKSPAKLKQIFTNISIQSDSNQKAPLSVVNLVQNYQFHPQTAHEAAGISRVCRGLQVLTPLAASGAQRRLSIWLSAVAPSGDFSNGALVFRCKGITVSLFVSFFRCAVHSPYLLSSCPGLALNCPLI